MVSGAEDVTSVVFIGNPGVGKSTLHNALGANFKSGFSPVHGMSVGKPQRVVCRNQHLLLVDVPGINDHDTAESLAAGGTAIDYNLRILRDRLNDGSTYVIFFVIDPNPNGTVRAEDLALMKLILGSIEEGPRIGLIMTLIRQDGFATITAPKFMSTSLKQVGAELKFFDTENHLFLRRHTVAFNESEVHDIQRYILSFEPRHVRIREVPSNALSLTAAVERPLVRTQLRQDRPAPDMRIEVRNPSTTCKESVIFIGVPGTGKSTLHNALGGSFETGFGTREAQQFVECNGRNLRLVDIPPDDYFEVELPADLWSFRKRYGDSYVIFFVWSPRNGRIFPSDLALLQGVLSKNKGATIGLIFTQVLKRHVSRLEDPSFKNQVVEEIRKLGVDVSSLLQHGILILPAHEKYFSKDEVSKIRSYVLSFFKWPADRFESKVRRFFKLLTHSSE